ncbi:hypothetical protein PIB30_072146 [Stylosanthes scabra]|uniref:Uncharacterized protein n=1 Tax=Stylosanthes scabra TaxID=79078 RepID=A0ABU6ZMT4_9FABA|nr:hypothetical protein [Stylosanthes scabra]
MRKGVLEVDSVNALMTQLRTINKKLEKLEASAVGIQVICGICGGPHENHNCISVQDDQFLAAQVNYEKWIKEAWEQETDFWSNSNLSPTPRRGTQLLGVHSQKP